MGEYFRIEEEAHIANFLVNALRGKEISMDFLKCLRERCIIDDTTTLSQLTTEKYSGFMSALFLSMSLKLPDTPQMSNYGLGIFSDLEVLHNLGAQRKRQDFAKENPDRCNNLTSVQLDQLSLNSGRLRRWVNSQRNALISHWDLPEGEPKPKVEKPRKATKERIQEEAAKKMDDVSTKRAREQLHELIGDMVADKDKVEDKPNSDDEAELAIEGKRAVKAKSAPMDTEEGDDFGDDGDNQVFTVPALIAQFPQIAIDGMFIRINVAEGKVFSLDHEGTEESFDIFEEFTL